jgi:hypothetical protein
MSVTAKEAHCYPPLARWPVIMLVVLSVLSAGITLLFTAPHSSPKPFDVTARRTAWISPRVASTAALKPTSSGASTPAPPAAPAPQPTPAPPAGAPADPNPYGCGPALAYLSAHGNPEFTFICPGYADGREAMTCVNVSGLCAGQHLVVINDPCAAAYMNEAYNSQSWSDSLGQFTRPIDPFGAC